ncbi:olfactory receptor 6N2-like [Rhinatrema bivittatum]|uniref:olfactory receptor 6N2-like n=1 Tax=Rhinatrema bivittatum TaxID=194408 RepID=UPI00112EC5AF|nr:olfactory receptor 6N2-like [Rhinatrema bivittatum]
MGSSNHSFVSEFIIMGFPSFHGLHILFFMALLIIYLLTITGNVVIFLIIRLEAHLHIPMYFFISVLSFLEIWYTAVTIPKMLANLITDRKSISFHGCLLQTYFFHSLGATECYLLTVMAYDRYLAICNPLRYPAIMTTKFCFQLTAGCWICGFLCPVTEVILISKLPFCGRNEIQHIFCDFPPLLSLACTDTSTNVLVDFAINAFIILVTFLFIMSSYIKIIITILKIKSSKGRRKAFSTCGAHLTVVLIFFSCIIFMYVRLTKSYSLNYDRTLAIIYSVLTPLFNPIIYSLRNKEIRAALWKILHKQQSIIRSHN